MYDSFHSTVRDHLHALEAWWTVDVEGAAVAVGGVEESVGFSVDGDAVVVVRSRRGFVYQSLTSTINAMLCSARAAVVSGSDTSAFVVENDCKVLTFATC